jgi:mRNA interferase RelE/StbE
MPTWTVKIERDAEKALEKLDAQMQRRILGRLRQLEANPRGQGCIKLAGSQKWRTRVGDYRIIYDIQDSVLVVIVIKIGHRREVYR